jgi:hypothetical protein
VGASVLRLAPSAGAISVGAVEHPVVPGVAVGVAVGDAIGVAVGVGVGAG